MTKIIIGLLIAASVLTGCTMSAERLSTGGVQSTGAATANGAQSTGATTANGAQATDTITAEEAKTIALEQAGLTADQVTGLRAELDRDDGRLEWDVDFRSGGYEYDYTIHAQTGKILDVDKDWID